MGVIDAILKEDQERPRKQRPTAKRIYPRLREEHGCSGGYTIVKDYVRVRKLSQREMFAPLVHPPGNAPADPGKPGRRSPLQPPLQIRQTKPFHVPKVVWFCSALVV